MYLTIINLLQFFSCMLALYLLCKDNMTCEDLIIIFIITLDNLIIDDIIEQKDKKQ